MLKFQSPSKYSPFDAIHLSRYFFSWSEQFWTWLLWRLLLFLTFFVSPLSHWQNISLGGHFSSGETNKQKNCSRQDWVNGGHAVFHQKLLNVQRGVGWCACNSSIMKWANTLKDSSIKMHWSQRQPLTTTPAGALTQMGSWNTHLVGEACTTRCPPSGR